MSLQSISDEKRVITKTVSKWADMLCNPEADQVRAPSLSPDYCSVAKIVKSFDVDASASLSSTVAITPDPLVHIITSSSTGLVTVAGPISVETREGAVPVIPKGSATVRRGTLVVSQQDMTSLGTVTFIDDLDQVNVALNGFSAIPMTIAGGVELKYAFKFPEGTWYRVFSTKGAVITYYTLRWATSGSQTLLADNIVAGGCDYVGVQIVNSAGVPYNAPRDISVYVNFECTAATVPTSAFNMTGRIVSSTLMEESEVTHVRCTSLKVLVTDMTPEIDQGGEVVTCRNRKALLAQPTTSDLMSAIKALPEERTWRSANIKTGAFAFYMPDDIESYEPRAPGQGTSSDNILIICLRFAKNTGIVRIIVTSTWEYYTPRQVIARALNYSWTDESRCVFEEIMKQPACSGNSVHGTLIAGVRKAAKLAEGFYDKNSYWMNPMAKQLASTVISNAVDNYVGAGTSEKVMSQVRQAKKEGKAKQQNKMNKKIKKQG